MNFEKQSMKLLSNSVLKLKYLKDTDPLRREIVDPLYQNPGIIIYYHTRSLSSSSGYQRNR